MKSLHPKRLNLENETASKEFLLITPYSELFELGPGHVGLKEVSAVILCIFMLLYKKKSSKLSRSVLNVGRAVRLTPELTPVQHEFFNIEFVLNFN